MHEAIRFLRPDDAEFLGVTPWTRVHVVTDHGAQLSVRLPDGRVERLARHALVSDPPPSEEADTVPQPTTQEEEVRVARDPWTALGRWVSDDEPVDDLDPQEPEAFIDEAPARPREPAADQLSLEPASATPQGPLAEEPAWGTVEVREPDTPVGETAPADAHDAGGMETSATDADADTSGVASASALPGPQAPDDEVVAETPRGTMRDPDDVDSPETGVTEPAPEAAQSDLLTPATPAGGVRIEPPQDIASDDDDGDAAREDVALGAGVGAVGDDGAEQGDIAGAAQPLTGDDMPEPAGAADGDPIPADDGVAVGPDDADDDISTAGGAEGAGADTADATAPTAAETEDAEMPAPPSSADVPEPSAARPASPRRRQRERDTPARLSRAQQRARDEDAFTDVCELVIEQRMAFEDAVAQVAGDFGMRAGPLSDRLRAIATRERMVGVLGAGARPAGARRGARA